MELLVTAFVTLFVAIDPVGNVPMYLSLTHGATNKQRRLTAIKACLIGCGILLIFLFAGKGALEFFGISMPAFRIAGGLLLFVTAFEMLFAKRRQRRQDTVEKITEETDFQDVSVFPLAMPLLTGPGSIATITLLSTSVSTASDTALLVLAVVSIMAITILLFLIAARFAERISPTLIDIMTRLFGLLLAALSVQYVIDGVAQAFLA